MNGANNFLSELLRSLKFGLPFLMVYAIGIVFALAYWRRWPAPSLFTLLACLIKMTATLVYALLVALVAQGELRISTFEVLGLLVSIIDASGYVLLLVAVYCGRAAVRPRRLPEWWDDPEDGPRPADSSTGIQERKG